MSRTCKHLLTKKLASVLIASISMLIFACSDSKQPDLTKFDIETVHEYANNTKEDLTLTVKREVVFYPDTNSRNFSLYIGYLYDKQSGEEYFLNRNEFINGIDIYDFKTGQLINRIDVPQEGPGSVGKVSGFYAQSLDSIFIFDRIRFQVILINDKGDFIDQYSLPFKYSNNVFTTVLSKFFVDNNDLIINQTVHAPPEKSGNSPTSFRYDIAKKEVIGSLDPLLPEELASNGYGTSQLLQRNNKGHNGSVVVRFGPLPFIYHYNYITDELNHHMLKSKYQIGKIDPTGKIENSRLKYLEAAYLQTLYDPYKKLYYSIFHPDIPEFDVNGDENDLEDMQMSVIIADTLFRYRGEIQLEKDKYLRTPLITREGIMFPKSHTNYDEVEGEMKYDLFEVQPLEAD